MNFEQLQSAWSAQTPSAPAARALDLAKLTRSLAPEINRRRRFLAYAIFVLLLGLIILPVLTVANYRHQLPAHPTWYWIYFGGWMLIQAGLLVAAVRALERHGAVRAQSARSIRDLALATLASVEAEMRDCRLALWIAPPLVLLQVINLFVNFPPPEIGWTPFLARAAFAAGLPLVMALGFRRHYRTHLAPARQRQQTLLHELT